MRETISTRKLPIFRGSQGPEEFLYALPPWLFANLIVGSILLAGIISLVWNSDMGWTGHSRPGQEMAGIVGTSDRDLSPMECGDRKVSRMAEVTAIR